MKPSAPTQPVWLIALVTGGLGIVGHFVHIPVITGNQFWLVSAGFILLVLGTLLKGF